LLAALVAFGSPDASFSAPMAAPLVGQPYFGLKREQLLSIRMEITPIVIFFIG
jgi:hypothetical protein